MPPKKATNASTKRKTAEPIVPKVKDPFSASKRQKKEDNDVVEIENDTLLDKGLMNTKGESEDLALNGTKNKDENKHETNKRTEIDVEDEEKKENMPKSKAKKVDKEEQEDEVVEEIEIDEKSKTETNVSKLYNKDEFAKCSNGKDWNFKICSWNINGIRAWVEVF